MPQTLLTDKPPAALTGHKSAQAHWVQLIKLYAEVDGVIATAFDENILIKYCLIQEECEWLAKIRETIAKQWSTVSAKLTKMTKKEITDLETYFKTLNQLNALLTRLQGYDARLDGKRKLALIIEQSLYLTPRSRAGVAPPTKEAEPEKSDTEKALE